MKIFKKTPLKQNKVSLNKEILISEEEYYTQLFTKDPQWSSINPNDEELARWQIIEKYIYYIKGSFSNEEHRKPEILDLGCGRGWLTNLLSKYGNMTGIEPIEPVVEYAKKNYPKLNLINGTSKDLLSNNLHNKFDIIVSSEVIEHIPDHKKSDFVTDIHSLLKENGFVIITTPRKEAEEQWQKFCSPDQPIEDWISEIQLKSYFESQNFTPKLFDRLSIKPVTNAPEIELYQLCLFQKKS